MLRQRISSSPPSRAKHWCALKRMRVPSTCAPLPWCQTTSMVCANSIGSLLASRWVVMEMVDVIEDDPCIPGQDRIRTLADFRRDLGLAPGRQREDRFVV